MQPSPLRRSGCNTLSHSGLANVNTRKRMFYPLIILEWTEMFENVLNRNAKHTESGKKKTFQNGPKKFFRVPPNYVSRSAMPNNQFLARLHEVQKSYCSHPGRTRSRSTLLKFSRSLYLGNHSSESIHTWTIGTQ